MVRPSVQLRLAGVWMGGTLHIYLTNQILEHTDQVLLVDWDHNLLHTAHMHQSQPAPVIPVPSTVITTVAVADEAVEVTT